MSPTSKRAAGLLAVVLAVVPSFGWAANAEDHDNRAAGSRAFRLEASMARETQAQAYRASAAGRAQRASSRTAYRGLSAAGAVQVVRANHPDVLAPAVPRLAGSVASYLGDHAARLTDGRLADSMLPLRVQSVGGEKVPVDLSLHDDAGAFVPKAALVPIRIGKRLGDGVSLPSGVRFTIALPDRGTSGEIVGSDVFYAGAGADTDAALKPVAGGVESFVMLRSPASPEQVAFDLFLPAGAVLRDDGRGWSIVSGGRVTGSVTAPAAVDAQGATVPVSSTLRHGRLLVNIPHRDRDFAYPIALDPTVSDGFNWPGGETSNFGWTYAPGTATLGPAFQPYPYPNGGAGLWMTTNSARSFTSGDWSQWVYTAPGDSSVTAATFGDLDQNNIPNSNVTCMNLEISGAGGPSFLNRCDDYFDNWSASLSHSYSATNDAIFGEQIGATGVRQAIQDHMGAVTVYITDNAAPSVASTTSPTGWTSNRGAPISTTFTDSGVGIASGSMSGPSGWSGNQSFPGTGCVRIRCNSTLPVSGTVSNLPDGDNVVTPRATDRAGNPASQTLHVKVDTTAPTASESGDGWPGAGGVIAAGSHSVTVAGSDPRSGVQSIEFKIDGGTGGPDSDQTATNSACAPSNGGCSTSFTHTFTYDSSRYSAGPHTLTVIMKDAAGPTANAATVTQPATFANANVLAGATPCTASATTLSSGYIANAFVGLQLEQPDSQTTRVCYQAADPLRLVNQYGVIEVRGGMPGAAVPSYDSGGDTCDTYPVDGATGSGRVAIGYRAVLSAVWVCVLAPGVSERVIVPIAVSGVPTVAVGTVTPTPLLPASKPWPNQPSNACVASGGTTLVAYTVGTTDYWLAYAGALNIRAATTDPVKVCSRVENNPGAGRGGVAAIDIGDATGFLPDVGTDPDDLSPCSSIILHLTNPIYLHLDSSPSGSSPQSVCVDAGLVKERIYAGAGPGGSLVTFTPDPGTP